MTRVQSGGGPRGRRFEDVDISAVDIDVTGPLEVIASTFVDCTFTGVVGESGFGAGTAQSLYRDCRFVDCSFTSVAPGNARFEGCSFEGVAISRFFGNAVELVRCSFVGALSEVNLSGRPPGWMSELIGRNRNEIVDNDFSTSALRGVSLFHGVDLGRQVFPDTPECVVLDLDDSILARVARELSVIGGGVGDYARVRMKMFADDARRGDRQALLQRRDWDEEGALEAYAALLRVAGVG